MKRSKKQQTGPAITTKDAKEKAKAKVSTTDSFSNPTGRLGFGTPNHIESTQYPLTRLTQNYQLMKSLYRSHWIIRRIIDVIPEDMCKSWWKITSQLPPELIERFDKQQRKINLKAKVLEGLKWGRLYGGAGGVILIKGHEDILDQPLNLDEVMPGSFKGLIIGDRWSGIYPQLELCKDLDDPELGLPDTYQITSEAIGGSIKIHHSRIIRFVGRDLPFYEKQAEIYWGASEIEHIYDELRKRDNTSWNIAQLVFLANLRVLKMKDTEQIFSVGNNKAMEDLYGVLQAQNWLMSNMGMQILGAEDEFTTHSYSFGGLAEVYQNIMSDLAGAAEMPQTKLFGRSPAGLNSTGDSDLQNYYETIEQKQETYLRPIIEKLLPIMCMSEFGMIPDDIDFRFNPIAKAKDSDKVDTGSKHTSAIIDTYNAGLISQQVALKELRQMEESTGMWSNIDDNTIDTATTEVQQQGEILPDGLGNMLGQSQENKQNNKGFGM
jgi:phage-related protein (TIGR01555 family)